MDNITITMSLSEYEELRNGYKRWSDYVGMFETAHDIMRKNNYKEPILTRELKRTIEEIYC